MRKQKAKKAKGRRKIPKLAKITLSSFMVPLTALTALQFFLAQPSLASEQKLATKESIENKVENNADAKGSFSIDSYLKSDLGYDINTNLKLYLDIGTWKDRVFFLNFGMRTPLDICGGRWQPKKVKYLIEPGLRIPINNKYIDNFKLIYTHESWHDPDYDDNITEDFDMLGVRVEGKNKKIDWSASIGKYVKTVDVDYDLGGRVGAEIKVWGPGSLALFLGGDVHLITKRGGGENLNYSIGLRLKKEGCNFSPFILYEREHDADRFEGETDDSLLTGIKYEW